jgi:hypothetical protein
MLEQTSEFRKALDEAKDELSNQFKDLMDAIQREQNVDRRILNEARSSTDNEQQTARAVTTMGDKLQDLLSIQTTMLTELSNINSSIKRLNENNLVGAGDQSPMQQQETGGGSLGWLIGGGAAIATAVSTMFGGGGETNTAPTPPPRNNISSGSGAITGGGNNNTGVNGVNPESIPPVSSRTTYDMSSPTYTAEGLSIRDLSVPQSSSSPYGVSATRNRREFEGIVFHHTGQGTTGENIARYGQRVDEDRGGAFGYHFLITPEGEIIQAAPMDVRTNHMGGMGSGRNPDFGLGNENAIGISLIAADQGATPEQLAAATRLGESLARDFGISPDMISSHGETSVPGHRMATEGVEAASLLRGRLSSAVTTETTTDTPLEVTSDSIIPTSASEQPLRIDLMKTFVRPEPGDPENRMRQFGGAWPDGSLIQSGTGFAHDREYGGYSLGTALEFDELPSNLNEGINTVTLGDGRTVSFNVTRMGNRFVTSHLVYAEEYMQDDYTFQPGDAVNFAFDDAQQAARQIGGDLITLDALQEIEANFPTENREAMVTAGNERGIGALDQLSEAAEERRERGQILTPSTTPTSVFNTPLPEETEILEGGGDVEVTGGAGDDDLSTPDALDAAIPSAESLGLATAHLGDQSGDPDDPLNALFDEPEEVTELPNLLDSYMTDEGVTPAGDLTAAMMSRDPAVQEALSEQETPAAAATTGGSTGGGGGSGGYSGGGSGSEPTPQIQSSIIGRFGWGENLIKYYGLEDIIRTNMLQ